MHELPLGRWMREAVPFIERAITGRQESRLTMLKRKNEGPRIARGNLEVHFRSVVFATQYRRAMAYAFVQKMEDAVRGVPTAATAQQLPSWLEYRAQPIDKRTHRRAQNFRQIGDATRFFELLLRHNVKLTRVGEPPFTEQRRAGVRLMLAWLRYEYFKGLRWNDQAEKLARREPETSGRSEPSNLVLTCLHFIGNDKLVDAALSGEAWARVPAGLWARTRTQLQKLAFPFESGTPPDWESLKQTYDDWRLAFAAFCVGCRIETMSNLGA